MLRQLPRVKPRRYPSFAALFLAWTALAALGCARYALVARDLQKWNLPEILSWFTCYYPWLFITPLVFRLERRYPLTNSKWPKHLALLAIPGLFLSYFAYLFTTFLDAGIKYAFHELVSMPNSWWSIPRREFALEQGLYWFTVGATCVVRILGELQQKEREAVELALQKSQLESDLRQAELENLRIRLNPHFLFNCLQNISTLTQHDPKTATKMLTRLGELLRTAFQRDSESEVALETELSLTQCYLSLEKMRFGDRLSVLLDIAPETEKAMVPTFLLQPLVENAIKHGLQGANKTGLIWIRSAGEAGRLTLTIRDNGVGIPVEHPEDLVKGIGLGSTCERLARLYPEQHTFSIQNLREGGTEIRISLPLRLKRPGTENPHYEQPASADRR